MVEKAKSWMIENSTFLIAQGLVLIASIGGLVAYYVKMETRVSIMETRGAAYTAERLGKIDERITILEQGIKRNESTIERVVDILTRELNKPVK